MALTLRDVLRDPVFTRTAPVWDAAASGLAREVRWVYTHERIDVAQFLQGGELLIIEGSELFPDLSPDRVRSYVRSLATAGIAGLALELLGPFTSVPETLAAAGREFGIPIVGLRRRVHFVQLSEAINSRISRERLATAYRLDDLYADLEHRLATVHDIETLLDVIVQEDNHLVAATLMIDSGRTLASAQEGTADQGSSAVPVLVGSTHLGTLIVGWSDRADDGPASRWTIAERLSRAVAPPLLRLQPPTEEQWLRSELFADRTSDQRTPRNHFEANFQIKELGADPTGIVSALAARFADPLRSVADALEAVDRLLSPHGTVMTSLMGDELSVLVFSPAGGDAGHLRTAVRATADTLVALGSTVIAISALGGPAREVASVLADTRATLHLHQDRWGAIYFARDDALTRFVGQKALSIPLDDFLRETLGPLLMREHHDALEAVAALGKCVGNKTAAASMLGISRQTMHSRLSGAADVLGVSRDTSTWGVLCVAGQLAHSR